MHSLPVGTEAHPKLWFQKCQKDINALSSQSTCVIGEILVLPEEDSTLLVNGTTAQGALSELDFKVGRQHYHLEETPKVSEAHHEPTVVLPMLSVPTFDGNVLNWAIFWEQF